ncbi:MAG: hypothetical protein ACRDMV_01440 [Streptosporangiales bacterium]
MIRDAAKSLREPIAWVLLGCVVLYLVSGLWDWFADSVSTDEAHPFLYRSYYAVGDFLSFTVAAALVAAVVVATLLPNAIKRAKPITLAALSLGGLMLLLGVITLFVGLFYEGSEYSDLGLGDKGQHLLTYFPAIGFLLIPLLLAVAVLRSQEMSPPRPRPQMPQQWGGYPQQPPAQQAMPGYGQPQPQQPYGWPGGGQQPPSGPPMNW